MYRKKLVTVKEKEQKQEERYFLMCERKWVYNTLMVIAGFYGAYTFLLRGNVFCNAQTGNVVLMGMAFGSGDIKGGCFFLIPISAYVFGSFASEILPNPIKYNSHIRWDTILIMIEMVVVTALGFVPESAPVQISQVAINFIASMQYNTFRQAEGMPMATTFATNHIRQIGVTLAKKVKHPDASHVAYDSKIHRHFEMLCYFFSGSLVGTILCNRFLGKALWATLIPLAVLLVAFLYADLVLEKDLKHLKPSGH